MKNRGIKAQFFFQIITFVLDKKEHHEDIRLLILQK